MTSSESKKEDNYKYVIPCLVIVPALLIIGIVYLSIATDWGRSLSLASRVIGLVFGVGFSILIPALLYFFAIVKESREESEQESEGKVHLLDNKNVCRICFEVFTSEDEIFYCPYCKTKYHLKHFTEELGDYTICYVCEEDIFF